MKNNILIAGSLFVIIFLFTGYFLYTQTAKLGDATQKMAALEQSITRLESELEEKTQENTILNEALEQEKNRNEDFQNQISEIAGTVGILDKLAKTDEELLQKYSKVYFLNEHYMPSDLRKIDEKYVYDKSRDYYFHGKALNFLRDMFEEAEDDGVDLRVTSAFRSFDEQTHLKGAYTVTYGSGANTFSADQGYSEHQLGTTIDIVQADGTPFVNFQSTEAYAWLTENAHKYGFVLSYPPDNAYYQFEPWHWRFVGKDLARKLNRDNMYFYDMPQREINEYLVEIFD